MVGTIKKPKATPTTNPCGLTAREVEIAVLAWKCQGEDGKVDKHKLAVLARIPLPDSADRMWRMVKAKITAATMPSDNSDGPGTPGTPGTPATPDGGNDGAVLGATDPPSPSVVASKKKNAAKVAGRKRTKKEADDEDDEGIKIRENPNEGEGGERPKKAAKHVKSGRIITMKEDPSDASGEAKAEAGEV